MKKVIINTIKSKKQEKFKKIIYLKPLYNALIMPWNIPYNTFL